MMMRISNVPHLRIHSALTTSATTARKVRLQPLRCCTPPASEEQNKKPCFVFKQFEIKYKAGGGKFSSYEESETRIYVPSDGDNAAAAAAVGAAVAATLAASAATPQAGTTTSADGTATPAAASIPAKTGSGVVDPLASDSAVKSSKASWIEVCVFLFSVLFGGFVIGLLIGCFVNGDKAIIASRLRYVGKLVFQLWIAKRLGITKKAI